MTPGEMMILGLLFCLYGKVGGGRTIWWLKFEIVIIVSGIIIMGYGFFDYLAA